VKGIKEEPFSAVNTSFAGYALGKVSLKDVEVDNSGVAFGVAAGYMDSVKYSVGEDNYKLSDLESPADSSSNSDLNVNIF